jgi:hypothetical protein
MSNNIGNINTNIADENKNKISMKISTNTKFSCMRKIFGDSLIPEQFKDKYLPETFDLKITFVGNLSPQYERFLDNVVVNYIVFPAIAILDGKYIISDTFDKNYMKDLNEGEYITTDLNTNNEGMLLVISLLINDIIKDYLKDEEKSKEFKDQLKQINYIDVELKSMNYTEGQQTYSHIMQVIKE